MLTVYTIPVAAPYECAAAPLRILLLVPRGSQRPVRGLAKSGKVFVIMRSDEPSTHPEFPSAIEACLLCLHHLAGLVMALAAGCTWFGEQFGPRFF